MLRYSEHITGLHKKLYPKEYLLKQVIRAKQYIDQHYAQPITVEDMAGEAFYSKFHFIRLFKTMYGVTPYQYLRSFRVEKAKKLLLKGQSATVACNAVGFDSASSFAALFRKATGTSPSGFAGKNKPV